MAVEAGADRARMELIRKSLEDRLESLTAEAERLAAGAGPARRAPAGKGRRGDGPGAAA